MNSLDDKKVYEILIVDDTLENLQLLNDILVARGYKVRSVSSGETALESIAFKKPDLILLDIIMPKMDGHEVCAKLKQNKITQDIPIIFLTARTDEKAILQGFELGAADYVTKPFLERELIARIAMQLDLKEYQDSLKKELKLKEDLLTQQNKMATIGEMFENIVHQWKQPLSIITTISSGITMQKETGVIIDEIKEKEFLEDITQNAQYLADTIDTFRNFFKQKKKVMFNMSEVINKTTNLIMPTLKDYGIKLDIKSENIEYIGLVNELIQVLINIIKNSQDEFEKKDIKNPKIEIEAKKTDIHAYIMIRDNAGGIPEDIIDKIFDPYFTTKDKEKGTGIGLYMSQNIIRDHFHGSIAVQNRKNGSLGAEFKIILPIEFNDLNTIE